MTDKILWDVKFGNVHYIAFAVDRERAKGLAHTWIGGNPDEYTVTPITEKGDRIHLGITLQV